MSDYLQAGLAISTSIAIDFTGSNLEYTNPKSLHYLHPDGTLNVYQEVITKIAEIFDVYDKTKKTPVYGFGAKSEELKLKRVSHNFYVSGDIKTAFAEGEQGILKMYKNVLPKLEFLGPTYLCPLIKSVTGSVISR